jgi:hypothetical protein
MLALINGIVNNLMGTNLNDDENDSMVNEALPFEDPIDETQVENVTIM